MAKAAKAKYPSKSQKSPDKPDEPEIEEVEADEDNTETVPEAAPETPPAESDGHPNGEPADTTPASAGSPAKPVAIKLAGTGTLSIMADGKANTVERGKKFKASPELVEALKAHSETVEED